MSSQLQLNDLWCKSILAYGATFQARDNGKKRKALNAKSLDLLEALWARPHQQTPDFGGMLEAGKTIRWWSDPHFGHDRIRHLCNRVEFSDVADMDRVLMGNAVAAAASADLVVCLGDYAMDNPWLAQRRLADVLGDKHVGFVGNHDTKGVLPAVWASRPVLASAAFSLPVAMVRDLFMEKNADQEDLIDWRDLPKRVNFGVCHWPIPADLMPSRDWLNLHGHIHNKRSGPLQINCSVEAIGYQPKTLAELLTPDLMMDFEAHWKGASLDRRGGQPGDQGRAP